MQTGFLYLGGGDKTKLTHKFVWGNNEKRAELKDRLCRILAHGAKGSVVVEFENGQRECISRRAIRRKDEKG